MSETALGTIRLSEGDLKIIDLDRLAYRAAYDRQVAELERIAASRDTNGSHVGTLLLVEHDPVITVSNRPTAAANLTATPDMLARAGITVEPTDRGGDITYHGPGQLVAYPILDLNRLHLRLHDYMRLLEQTVINTLAVYSIRGDREQGATGVWVGEARGVRLEASERGTDSSDASRLTPHASKIAAMGVRVRRWISMHGLALNVDPDLSHFNLIVPCGLTGRSVTSMAKVLGTPPPLDEVKQTLVQQLASQLSIKR